jgi:hypothetical protein
MVALDMDVEQFRALQFNYCRKKHTGFLTKMNFVLSNISCNCVSYRNASVSGSASGKVKCRRRDGWNGAGMQRPPPCR